MYITYLIHDMLFCKDYISKQSITEYIYKSTSEWFVCYTPHTNKQNSDESNSHPRY
jgi:hypothetical protein